MNTMLRRSGAVAAMAASLLAGCASAPSERTSAITLRYAQNDYVVYEIDANAEGRYEVHDYGELTYLTRRLQLDEDELAALARLAGRQNFYALPADLDELPDPDADESLCDPSETADPGCERLEHVVVTSDCGPDSRLRMSDGRRSREVHWQCGSEPPAVIRPLLDAIQALFAEHPTVTNAPAPRRWRR